MGDHLTFPRSKRRTPATLPHHEDHLKMRERVDPQAGDPERPATQQPPPGQHRHHLRRRHREHRPTPTAAQCRQARPHLRHRVGQRAAGRNQPVHAATVAQQTLQIGESRPDGLRPVGEPGQPAPHRRSRAPRQLRSPAPAPPGGPRHQHRPDQTNLIQPAPQQQSRQQHMRTPATIDTCPRTDTPPQPNPPDPTSHVPHKPRRPPPPPARTPPQFGHLQPPPTNDPTSHVPHKPRRRPPPPASTPPQFGHLNSPPTSIRSTTAGSGPTLSNAAS